MNYEELLEFLDLTSPEEFEYFENLADLLECEEDIEEEALEQLLSGVDGENLSELVQTYFNEMLEKIPDKSVDIYTLLSTIGMSLAGLAKSLDEQSSVSIVAEEMNRFRRWYMLETEVACKDVTTGKEVVVPLSEALVMYRMESLSGDEYSYDFDSCLDYQLDEYVVSFGDIVSASYEGSDDNYDDEDHEHHHHHHHDCDCGHEHHHYDESILNDGYVYDDEFDENM